MKLRMTLSEFFYISFLGILAGILLSTVISMLTPTNAEGAEPDQRQHVQASAKPDATIKLDNSPDLAGRYHLRKRTKRFFRLVSSTLPPGTPTQLALISAIRAHPDAPASTDGMRDPMLAKEAERHSLHQARIQTQGHHNWDRRFRRINAGLPEGFTAIEVCAESWPGQTLEEAAAECVNSWRQSPGHWAAVSRGHPLYGYDMKRGRNGIWYATGIFGQD